jgi:CO dehydrogenase maturation factor
MGYSIAIAGKGGTGKTTIASLIIDWLRCNRKGSVLAVDADPNATLSVALGVEPQENIGQIVDSIAKDPSIVPAGMSKDEYINYHIQTSLSESDGFDLLVMGRPEGPGCYCYVNNVLRGNIQRLIEDYDFVVIDNEAGMEHFSRRTTRRADCLLIVSDYSIIGLRTAKNIYHLIKELNIEIKNEWLIVNRIKGRNEQIEKQIRECGIGLAGMVSDDSDLTRLCIEGMPIRNLSEDSPVKETIRQIGEKLWG